MSTEGIVLIVTNKSDITADLVVLEFQRRGTPYARFNTEDFPQRVQLSWVLGTRGVDGYICLPHSEVSLREVISVWYRRPIAPDIAESVQAPFLKAFAHRESQEALSGLWRTMDCFWMSCPDAINSASYKPRQLKLANALGFKVPKTLISNSPEVVERFQIECGQVIAKPLFSGDIQCEDERRVVFTTLVTHNDISARENIRLAPTIFQEYVRKELELRVTVIGEKVLAASINSQEVTEALHDWRRASPDSLCFRPYELPTSVSDKCVQLVATLGLTFGTIDMVKTPDGNYVYSCRYVQLRMDNGAGWRVPWLEIRAYTTTIATHA